MTSIAEIEMTMIIDSVNTKSDIRGNNNAEHNTEEVTSMVKSMKKNKHKIGL